MFKTSHKCSVCSVEHDFHRNRGDVTVAFVVWVLSIEVNLSAVAYAVRLKTGWLISKPPASPGPLVLVRWEIDAVVSFPPICRLNVVVVRHKFAGSPGSKLVCSI